MDRRGTAPTGDIIYMEGLDCVGKSSTGGLIMDALDEAGNDISQVQYNRPPTSEDLRHPWMWRFKKPDISTRKTALIWDRGPAGDFVYGNLGDLTESEKRQYYASFQKFDDECRSQGILFCKLLFVTDRDSLSSTLGKRLAHKRIVRDLYVWLDANSSRHERSGLGEIENHIDPTDFIALNKFKYNLHRFVDFALNTDHTGRMSAGRYSESTKSFQQQLEQYDNSANTRKHMSNPTRNSNHYQEIETLVDTQHDMFEDCSEISGNMFIAWKESLPYLFMLIAIPLSYLHQTWNVSFWGDE
uniref:Polyphosphate kinase-2-related domain-containing protein n=1 Tax=Chaetoceros debilis TaxID=122233 RepID=A0A7S3V9P1_9STRA